jgi:hypothetical protein
VLSFEILICPFWTRTLNLAVVSQSSLLVFYTGPLWEFWRSYILEIFHITHPDYFGLLLITMALLRLSIIGCNAIQGCLHFNGVGCESLRNSLQITPGPEALFIIRVLLRVSASFSSVHKIYSYSE